MAGMSVNRPNPSRQPGSGSVPGRGVPPQRAAPPPPPPPPPQAYHPSYADQQDDELPGSGVPPQLIVAASIVGVLLIAALITGIRSGGRSVKLEDLENEKYEDASDAFASKG